MAANRFREIRFLKSVYRPDELEECAAEIAFVGRSNVGKSTLLNAVCDQKGLARTSHTPGSTRSINVFSVGKDTRVIDLPGYGFASGPKDHLGSLGKMIEGYLIKRPALRSVVMIVDANVGPTKLDNLMAEWLRHHEVPFLIVANKCDKVGYAKQRTRRREIAQQLGLGPEELRWVSAEKGEGMNTLKKEIADILELP